MRRTTGGCRTGNAASTAAIAMATLIGFTGLAVDCGLVILAAQECQKIADFGCLAGAQLLPDDQAAEHVARDIGNANIPPTRTELYSVTTGNYDENEMIPGLGPAPPKGAFAVTARKWVRFHFLRVLGLRGIHVTRSAASAHLGMGYCIAPMWVSDGTTVDYGLRMDMHACDDETTQSRSYGIFGWLDTPAGVDWDDALKGLLPPDIEERTRVDTGDTVYNCPGQRTGQWMRDLETEWNSRLERAEWPRWRDDTFEDFHYDNPRIMIVPFVVYEGGRGNNARFTITRFGAWWLEDASKHGNDKMVTGRFIEFTRPGGLALGVKPTHLIQ